MPCVTLLLVDSCNWIRPCGRWQTRTPVLLPGAPFLSQSRPCDAQTRSASNRSWRMEKPWSYRAAIKLPTKIRTLKSFNSACYYQNLPLPCSFSDALEAQCLHKTANEGGVMKQSYEIPRGWRCQCLGMRPSWARLIHCCSFYLQAFSLIPGTNRLHQPVKSQQHFRKVEPA